MNLTQYSMTIVERKLMSRGAHLVEGTHADGEVEVGGADAHADEVRPVSPRRGRQRKTLAKVAS